MHLMEVGVKEADKTGTKKMTIIWDREGFDRKNFDTRFIEIMKKLLGMFQDNYAERLSKVLIIHPNWFLKFGITIMKPFMASKV